MYYIVDRIEGNFAVCECIETQEMKEIELDKLPNGINSGDVIKNEDGIFIIDLNQTEKRKQIIHNKTKGLWT